MHDSMEAMAREGGGWDVAAQNASTHPESAPCVVSWPPGGPSEAAGATSEAADDVALTSPGPSAQDLVIDDAARWNEAQDAPSDASAPGGAPRAAGAPGGADTHMARVSSFDQRFAERTPSDWDAAFKSEMQQAMAGSATADVSHTQTDVRRTSSFDQKFAERTPSDWDQAFQKEMNEAMAEPGSAEGDHSSPHVPASEPSDQSAKPSVGPET